jgi:branched-chain amino acid transport system substrate-binding protein
MKNKELSMRNFIAAVALAVGAGLSTAAQAGEIAIAINGPMTGRYATFGQQFSIGAKAAAADINAAGGVLGKTIKLEMNDDACDPKQADSVANRTIGARIPFVVGHFCSASSIAASKVYAEEGVLEISPASTNPDFTDKRAGPSIFRVCGRDDQQGGIAGAYLAKTFADKNIAILNDRSTYGKGLADKTKAAMNAAGKKEVLVEAFTPGEKDYTALVSKLKQANVDVAYIGGYHTEAGLILRQMRSQGMKTIVMGGDALVTNEYWQIVGDAGEGTIMTFSPDPRKNPAAASLVKQMQARNIDPEGYVLYTYAAIQVWKQAAEKAGVFSGPKLLEAMNAMQFDTAVGKFNFDKKGDPNLPPYAVYKWSKGKYAQIN